MWASTKPMKTTPLTAISIFSAMVECVERALLDQGLGRDVVATSETLLPARPRGGVGSVTFLRPPDQPSGSVTRSTVPPSAGVDLDLAAVPLHHDAPGDVEPEAGALADVLGREERLERARRDLRRHARAGVGDLDDDVSPSRRGWRAAACRRRPSRRAALSTRLVHTWLSSPGYASIRGQVGVVLADDGDRRRAACGRASPGCSRGRR